MHVIQPGWMALPVGIRLLMKRHVRAWDELYEALRVQVLDLGGKDIELRPEASACIARLVRDTFRSPAPAPATTPAPAHSVPLAAPVTPNPHASLPLASVP